jgi:hypothetical protein
MKSLLSVLTCNCAGGGASKLESASKDQNLNNEIPMIGESGMRQQAQSAMEI